ncbi:methenyl tetrahydrofolate cyclohydrolase [Pseudarthrobacter phenanthrenivorans Sphe3]|uniref:Methenyl tetrahydrofolate cyclohydrolase n=1 Tax=Pseudarthrobacter phenanthrenivorans (strain DSM 18606 / JCM 16027 / LMG 23796 / Sphe3) TaxID=930171 RepID=F0MB27_PSEPM|nr:cyclodeaminase/cyclohydrolase family protein [Pseudarthrobacter phenanthrenivorans]ADX72903.1 methenyl tetrahydrofolate cyclohydrolase [Pseudarthrobacter phenanthrenivorans Sphe3]
MTERDAVTTQRSTVQEWTRALAESKGSPGGGAGTGVMLAIAASLASMLAGYTEPKEHQRGDLAALHARALSLREEALRLADGDAAASEAFGAAFRLDRGRERDEAIHRASVDAAKASALLGERAVAAIDDLGWLASHGNPALIADVVVGFGALRAAVAGARTNVSFDLATLRSAGATLQEVEEQHPALWAAVQQLTAALERIDHLTASVDHRAAPTDAA